MGEKKCVWTPVIAQYNVLYHSSPSKWRSLTEWPIQPLHLPMATVKLNCKQIASSCYTYTYIFFCYICVFCPGRPCRVSECWRSTVWMLGKSPVRSGGFEQSDQSCCWGDHVIPTSVSDNATATAAAAATDFAVAGLHFYNANTAATSSSLISLNQQQIWINR